MEQFLVGFTCLAVFILMAFAPYFLARFIEAHEAGTQKSHPIQYSLRQFMGAIALIAIGITVGLAAIRDLPSVESFLFWLASGAAIGAGLFLPMRKPFLGAAIGAFIQLCSGWIILIARMAMAV